MLRKFFVNYFSIFSLNSVINSFLKNSLCRKWRTALAG